MLAEENPCFGPKLPSTVLEGKDRKSAKAQFFSENIYSFDETQSKSRLSVLFKKDSSLVPLFKLHLGW